MSLTLVPITDQLGWLPPTVSEAAPGSLGVPQGYDAYVKLFPVLGIDRSIPLASYSFACTSVADLNARVAFWNTYGIHQGGPPAERVERITYREAAALAGMPAQVPVSWEAICDFHGERPPNLGSSPTLEEAFIEHLVQVLGATTDTFFHGSVEEGNYRWDAEDMPVDWLERGICADLLSVYQRDNALPTYMFAADHAWCLYQAEWVSWSVIGCSAPLALALLQHSYLETLPLVDAKIKPS
ncbi:hypothetical protein [Hymenobacter metallicola]|uniref:Uncharacterized protein n=1 Tax=Hymenobacter metallicola TaxID=2563114 RepID=A0A4Z0PUT9_9BACT|nr:hypothetical protein [Hymenobacter metallicola]TGE21024.1 hypothetical protein E5K02_25000 [Hymenobacter metallicola]